MVEAENSQKNGVNDVDEDDEDDEDYDEGESDEDEEDDDDDDSESTQSPYKRSQKWEFLRTHTHIFEVVQLRCLESRRRCG